LQISSDHCDAAFKLGLRVRTIAYGISLSLNFGRGDGMRGISVLRPLENRKQPHPPLCGDLCRGRGEMQKVTTK
jgi:hypothetical protein